MSKVKKLSDRVSWKEHDAYTTIVISPRLERGKETLLTTWVLAWTVIGIIFIVQLFLEYTREEKLYMIVFLTFWAYYEYRVGYVWMWRRKGVELIKIEDGKLTYKRSINKYGKAYSFFLDNIRNFGKMEKEESFFKELERSFWVIGGERLGFEYQQKTVKFGVQLSDEETNKLENFLKSILKKESVKN
ncbi:MAG: hypothetical protein ACOZCO_03790 [Bacteroidota bacterium]